MKTGIYGIKNIGSGKMYIGSSLDIDARILSHISLLNTNKHSNSELQEDFNLSGIGNFQFKHLLYCNQNELIEHENRIMKGVKKIYNKRDASIGRHPRPPKKMPLKIEIEDTVFLALERLAEVQNRKVNNLIETILKKELDLL